MKDLEDYSIDSLYRVTILKIVSSETWTDLLSSMYVVSVPVPLLLTRQTTRTVALISINLLQNFRTIIFDPDSNFNT